MALRFRSLLAGLIASILTLGFIPAASALDERIIDVVSVTWSSAPAPKVSVDDIANTISSSVAPRWKALTTFKGSSRDRSLSFIPGLTLRAPIVLSQPMGCEGAGYSSLASSIRSEAYKRLAVADSKNRYLIILTPFAGCIWEGRAMIGEFAPSGITITMQNSASAFVITHELGHALGAGHSNFMFCSSGKSDGPWGSDCKAVEYGGTMDVMGNVETTAPLSTYHQWRMGLISNQEVKQSWRSESIELSAVDVASPTRAIFLRDQDATYWLEYRRARPESNYRAGLVIYRTDPPPISAIVSPNPEDSYAGEFGSTVGTDIWMLNFDDYTYVRSRANGSMTLPEGRTAAVFSGNISIFATATASEDKVVVTINRKADITAPPAPTLVAVSSWRFPSLEIIKAPYDDGQSAIEKFEARINAKVVELNSSASENFSPTYLNPFTAPKTVRVRDLPEGDYSLALRAIDLWGNTSPWSEEVKVSIDRGDPVIAGNIKINSATSLGANISLTGVRDEGVGLCLTQLVNEDGWVIAKSEAKRDPIFTLDNSLAISATAQVFDCIGNGLSANLKAKSSFIPASQSKRTGKWSATSLAGNQALRCSGKCSASFTTAGAVSILSADGALDIYLTSKLNSRLAAPNNSALRLSNTIEIGSRNKVLRVQGSNFTLLGVARVDLSITEVKPSPRLPIPIDPTIGEAAQSALSKMGFNQSDFTSDWDVLPMFRGTTLLDPTLDLCAASYKSESGRESRRQVSVNKANSPFLFLSTEVVRYTSKSTAAAALAELKSNYENCVKNKGGTESSGTFTDYTFYPLEGSKNLVSEANRVLVNATIGKGEFARQLLAFYQFNNNTFNGLYIVKSGNAQISESEVKRWSQVAETLAERLIKNS